MNPLFEKEYWSNGKLRSYQFYQNRECESKKWYENGQILCHQFYLDDKLEGESKAWHENGQLEWCVFYQNGKMEGEGKKWYENGCVNWHVYWINDTIFDIKFSIRKKYLLLKLKRNILYKVYKHKYNSILNEKLIPDLSKMIIKYL